MHCMMVLPNLAVPGTTSHPFPPAMNQGLCPSSPLTLGTIQFSNYCQFKMCKVIAHFFLIPIFPITNTVKQNFKCLLFLWDFSPGNCLFLSFAQFSWASIPNTFSNVKSGTQEQSLLFFAVARNQRQCELTLHWESSLLKVGKAYTEVLHSNSKGITRFISCSTDNS